MRGARSLNWLSSRVTLRPRSWALSVGTPIRSVRIVSIRNIVFPPFIYLGSFCRRRRHALGRRPSWSNFSCALTTKDDMLGKIDRIFCKGLSNFPLPHFGEAEEVVPCGVGPAAGPLNSHFNDEGTPPPRCRNTPLQRSAKISRVFYAHTLDSLTVGELHEINIRIPQVHPRIPVRFRHLAVVSVVRSPHTLVIARS